MASATVFILVGLTFVIITVIIAVFLAASWRTHSSISHQINLPCIAMP
jgi:hypothetical protein